MIPIAIVLQARMTSTRLPKKSLLPLAGVPLIEHIINRIKAVSDLDHIILAVTNSHSDTPLIETAQRLNITIIKGPEDDVLKRFLMAADQMKAEHIVRVCGDNPLIDRQLMRSLIHIHIEKNADYTITSDPIPLGTGTEVVRVDKLKQIAQTTTEPKYREHVTTWFHDHPSIGIQPRISAPAYLLDKNYHQKTLPVFDDTYLQEYQAAQQSFQEINNDM